MVSSWAGPPAMLMIFRKLFGSFSCQQIVRQNNFANFQHYFLQKVEQNNSDDLHKNNENHLFSCLFIAHIPLHF